MKRIGRAWDEICDLIIRPQRALYDVSMLGPKLFRIEDRIYERVDVEVLNPRGMILQCSHFQPIEKQRPASKLPVVVYCHGNCGSRVDSVECVACLLPYNITVFAFDFSGSGLSEGDYVSLGYYERQDLAAVVEHLMASGSVSKIGLWGRSMGATTSVMYGSRDPTVAAIVADSCFSSLNQVVLDLAETYRSWVPKALTKVALRFVRQTVLNKAQFDIRDLDTVPSAANCTVPIVFAHATEDDFVPIQHSETVHERYKGEDKTFIRFEGDHNSERPDYFHNTISKFFHTNLVENDPDLGHLPPPVFRSTSADSESSGSDYGEGDYPQSGDYHHTTTTETTTHNETDMDVIEQQMLAEAIRRSVIDTTQVNLEEVPTQQPETNTNTADTTTTTTTTSAIAATVPSPTKEEADSATDMPNEQLHQQSPEPPTTTTPSTQDVPNNEPPATTTETPTPAPQSTQ
eukprot:NODE_95_length_1639_cov_459.678571_g93_i0.p1 GENE.NODE_95_length_1639_cov_459.678571_g93_i0~~NODE_95_length_1639_cov_459.678571_g93_i0.p1  ORF type:complete len:460 (-),score=106.22 NODE_95_length_1639_cov_459.678571_g93_i0:185-1564(-)